MKTAAKLAVTAAVFAFSAVPAIAAGPGADSPSLNNAPSNEQARALGRAECQEFKRNFADNRSQFGKCVSASARVVRTRTTPREACGGTGLSRKPQGDERRSDFSACVIAAAQAERKATETESA